MVRGTPVKNLPVKSTDGTTLDLIRSTHDLSDRSRPFTVETSHVRERIICTPCIIDDRPRKSSINAINGAFEPTYAYFTYDFNPTDDPVKCLSITFHNSGSGHLGSPL